MSKGSRSRATTPLRIISAIFGILLALLLLLLLLAPTLISTKKGQKWFVETINSSIEGHFSIDSLKISWLGPQDIQNLHLFDAAGNSLFSFTSLKSDSSLFSFLFSHRLSKTELIAPSLNLNQDEQGRFTIHEALKSKKKTKTPKESSKDTFYRWPTGFRGELIVRNGCIFYKTLQIEGIELTNIDIIIRNKPEHIEIHADIQQGVNPGVIVALINTEQGHLSATVNISRLPTALFEQLSGSKLLETAIGPYIDLQATIESQVGNLSLTCKVDSQNLKGNIIGQTTVTSETATFNFDPKSELAFTFTPALFDKLFCTSQWKLANRADIRFTLKQLQLEMRSQSTLRRRSICLPFTAELELPRVELSHQDLGNVSLNQLKASFTHRPEGLFIDYAAQIASRDGLAKLAGEIVCEGDRNWRFSGTYQDIPFAMLELFCTGSEGLVKLFGPRFSLSGAGEWQEGKRVGLNYQINTHNLSMEGKLSGMAETFDLEGRGNLLLPRVLQQPLGKEASFTLYSEISSKGGLTLPKVNLKIANEVIEAEVVGRAGKSAEPFNFSDIDLVLNGIFLKSNRARIFDTGHFDAHVDGKKNRITAHIGLTNEGARADADKFDAVGQITINEFICDNTFNLSRSNARFSGFVHQLPSNFFRNYINPEWLGALIGPTLNFAYLGTFADQITYVDLDAQAQGLQAHLPLQINAKRSLSLNGASSIEWQLDNERFQTLLRLKNSSETAAANRYKLQQNATIELQLEELSLPPQDELSLNTLLQKGQLKGLLKSSPLNLEHIDSLAPLSIDKLAMEFTAKPLAQKVEGTLFANFYANSIPVSASSLVSLGFAIDHLLDSEGNWNWPHLALAFKGHLDLLPVYELLEFMPLDVKKRQRANAILGALLNASLNAEFVEQKGPITLDVKASNLKALLPLYYDHGNLTLTEGVQVELTLTDDVNRVLLREFSPILINDAISEHPLRLFINQEGFLLPLRPYSIKNVKVSKGVFDLGQIKIAKKGHIQSLMEFLKADKPTSDNFMEAWFTPIFFTLENGVLSYKRFDVLLGGLVHVALWGNIDLEKDVVQMTLGIDPKNLRRRFNIAGLSKKEMFQVKINGPTEKPQMDWSAAYTRLGILIARTAGGHIGYILGGIVEQIVEAFGEQPSPPPTTTPFPWDSSSESDPKAIPQENVTHPSASKAGLRKVLEFLIP